MDSSIRTLAVYLPQFHRVKENDLWWGEGFTEWTAVKKARSLFPTHEQPKEPLNDYYYDLMDKSTMEWQASLAKKYKIDGFCFYHYWFKDGRMILEKPAENLLMWKDIDMPFCFSWPSDSWGRTWSNLLIKNSWTEKFENQDSMNDGILLKQEFGGESQWKMHFDYLIPFFRDKRYITIDGKPVFIFYNAWDFPCLERMILYWRNLAVRNGFPGLYVIVGFSYTQVADAVLFPMNCNLPSECMIENMPLKVYSYDKAWEYYLDIPVSKRYKILWSGMVDYDDTPRRGDNGTVLSGFTVEKFKNYYALLLEKSIRNENPFLFLDAWNEWGEGMYLEPEKKYGYKTLEAIRDIASLNYDDLLIFNSENSHKNENKNIMFFDFMCQEKERYYTYYNLFKYWSAVKNSPEKIRSFFSMNHYHSIAIYGYGDHGKLLYKDLLALGIHVDFVIDKNKKLQERNFALQIPLYNPDDSLPVCDIIIVSVVDKYAEIAENLRGKMICPIISFYELAFTSYSL